MEISTEQDTGHIPSKYTTKHKKLVSSLIITALIISSILLWLINREASPIPQSIRKQVDFHIYYPDQAKLPQGYSFNASSVSASDQAIVYRIDHNDKQALAVTVQKKPSLDDLESFVKRQLPLNIKEDTPIGDATIGGIDKQLVVSLPSDTNSWLIITGKSNFDKKVLKQILNSFTN